MKTFDEIVTMSLDTFASHVMMIRPHRFGFNPETAENNAFQSQSDLSATEVHKAALEEFDKMVGDLRVAGLMVTVINDLTEPHTPDAVFPNNWVTFHANGAVITYPMFSDNRRAERREELLEKIMEARGYARRYSLEQYEEKNLFLEGTGSMVLDRSAKMAFACLSPRTDPSLLDKFCTLMGYRRCIFKATDRNGTPIYHTNVMMAIGHTFAIVCLQSIRSDDEREEVQSVLAKLGKSIIEISEDQMEQFAGNMLLMKSRDGQPILVMSHAARRSLDQTQVDAIETHATILSCKIPTIEKVGGGSVRCMMAELVDVDLGG